MEYRQTYSLGSSVPAAIGVRNQPTKDCAIVPLISAKLIKVVVAATLVRILSLCAQLTLLIPVRRQALQPAHKRTGLDECAHRRQSNVQVNEEVAPHKRLKYFPLTGLQESPDAEKAGLVSRLLRCGTWPLITYFTPERETCLFQRAFGTMSTPASHPGPRPRRELQVPDSWRRRP